MLAAASVAGFFFFMPKRGSQKPTALALSFGALLLLGVCASPLAWQHTYSILWGIVPLAYLCGTTTEKKWVAAISLFLGVSARAIVGTDVSSFLELHQSVFLCSLILVFLMAKQSRRLAL